MATSSHQIRFWTSFTSFPKIVTTAKAVVPDLRAGRARPHKPALGTGSSFCEALLRRIPLRALRGDSHDRCGGVRFPNHTLLDRKTDGLLLGYWAGSAFLSTVPQSPYILANTPNCEIAMELNRLSPFTTRGGA